MDSVKNLETSDFYSIGAVLYGMLTGDPSAFGTDVSGAVNDAWMS